MMEKFFCGEVLQEHPVYDACKQNGGKYQHLGLDQHADAEGYICGGKLSPDKAYAHVRQSQSENGIYLTPYGRIKENGGIEQIRHAEE